MRNRFARFLVNLIIHLTLKVEVINIENLPAEGGYIAASNHLGRLDVALVYYFLRRKDVTILAAEKYKKYAIWRWFVKALDSLFVDRYGADLVTLRDALGRLKRGGVLVLAPEGTRSKDEALLEARPGVSYLAARAGAIVVPVGVTGTEDRLVKANLLRLRRSKVLVRVGKPFTLPPLHGGDRDAQLNADTEELMCQIAALLPESHRGFYANHPRLQQLLNGQAGSEKVSLPG